MMPVVGIPLRPWSRENRPLRVMQSAAYFSAIERAGGVPLAIPPLAGSGHLETVLSRVDALCLPGG
jgi:gamma-glutamyl-gamma-aminobutyrate hydrolase PuuD